MRKHDSIKREIDSEVFVSQSEPHLVILYFLCSSGTSVQCKILLQCSTEIWDYHRLSQT